MQNRRLERYAPLAGVLFVVLAVAWLIVSNETPAADDGTDEVLRYWTENDSAEMTASIIASLAMLAFVWFAASVRTTIWRAEAGSGRLATLSFAGALIGATGILIGNSLEFAAADTAGDVPVAVTQTLSVLYADLFFPIAIGLMLFFIATGLAILRHGVLPSWLGWVAIVSALLFPTPLFFLPLLVLLIWSLVVSVLLYRAEAEPEPAG